MKEERWWMPRGKEVKVLFFVLLITNTVLWAVINSDRSNSIRDLSEQVAALKTDKENLMDSLSAQKRALETKYRPEYHHFSRHFEDKTENNTKSIILIAGAEGSGTYWFTYALNKVLKKHQIGIFHRQSWKDKKGFDHMNHDLWNSGPVDRFLTARETVGSAALKLFRNITENGSNNYTTIVIHRSAPDFDAKHYPDLNGDLHTALDEVGISLKVIILYRDPVDCAASNFRRAFNHFKISGQVDVKLVCMLTEKHLALESAQLQGKYPEEFCVMDYGSMSNEKLRAEQMKKVTTYLGMDYIYEELMSATDNFKENRHQSLSKLNDTNREFLDIFFTPSRRSQWSFLSKRAKCSFQPTTEQREEEIL